MTYIHNGKTYEQVPETDPNSCRSCDFYPLNGDKGSNCYRPKGFPDQCGAKNYIYKEVTPEIIYDPAKAQHLIGKRVEASDIFSFQRSYKGKLLETINSRYPFFIENDDKSKIHFIFVRAIPKEKSLLERFDEWLEWYSQIGMIYKFDWEIFNEIRKVLEVQK